MESIIDFIGHETETGVLRPTLRNSWRMAVTGPSQSGKSEFVYSLLRMPEVFSTPFHCISFHYGEFQREKFNQLKKEIPNINFYSGLPTKIEQHGSEHCLLILDDLINISANSESVLELFIKQSHHKNKSVCIMSQNLFFGGKFFRSISLNCDYMCLMKAPRDKSQIRYLSRQIFPENPSFITSAYELATADKGYSHLFLDLSQIQSDKARVWCEVNTPTPIVLIPP